MPIRKLGKGIEILLSVAALGVLAENVVLLRQNRRLRETAAREIGVGAQLRMLSGIALDGRVQNVSLASGGSELLIITFSPLCPECQANQEGWMRLASALKRKGLRVLWVSRDSVEITTVYCLSHGIPLADTLADPPFRTYLQLGMAEVPNTVLVGSDARIEKVWGGRLGQGGWNSVFAYFGERQELIFPVRSEVGAVATRCGPDFSDASAKSCK
jgi:peroxiredoxin